MAYDRYSKDLEAIRKRGVNVIKTPDTVLEAQLKSWDKVLAAQSAEPFFKKVIDSQKEWVKRTSAICRSTTWTARPRHRPTSTSSARPVERRRDPRGQCRSDRAGRPSHRFATTAAGAVARSSGAHESEFLLLVDSISTWVGKTFGWCILVLTFTTSYEVFTRYLFLAPTEWAFDASYMLYGALFMMAGAYTLSRNGHVRGDFLYRAWSPRTQAKMDLVLYFLFFFPGMLALSTAGYGFAKMSWMMNEQSSASPNRPDRVAVQMR